jgi:hypothetical protein
MIKNKRKLLTSVIVFVIVLSFLLPTTYHVSAYNENEIKVTIRQEILRLLKNR